MTTLRISTPADDIAEVLIDEQAIAAKVRELGTAIADDYRGKDLVLVSILKGALPFLADLMRQMPIPLALDFLEVSSYGDATESSGNVRILKDLAKSIDGPAQNTGSSHDRDDADVHEEEANRLFGHAKSRREKESENRRYALKRAHGNGVNPDEPRRRFVGVCDHPPHRGT